MECPKISNIECDSESFETDWDVDKYESSTMWDARRKFMVANKSRFPEQRLVTLSHIYGNIVYLHCSYPKELMDLVKEMESEIYEPYPGIGTYRISVRSNRIIF